MTAATEPAILPVADARKLRVIMLVLAFACGASVANLYYAQPLLSLIGHSFGIGRGAVTVVVTMTQIGYALGLAFLLPLGDLLENRRLASRTLVLTALALAGAALAPAFWVFLLLSSLIGITSVVAQVLVPLAANLAPPQTRGKFVGQVVSGLLLGIMLARSMASFAAAAWGWRSIYAISAVVMVLTSIVLARLLPQRNPGRVASYRSLLASSVHLARTEPVLVRRALAQALMFGAFTAYWTAIAYELADRHHLSQTGIAIFALIGAGGAAAAPIAGRLGDAGRGSIARIGALVLAIFALALAGLGASHLILLGLSGVLLDVAVQTHLVLGQRDIYAISGDARARITSVYMTSVFVGGAICSAITGVVHDEWGWTGVTIFATILPVIGVLLWVEGRLREAKTPAPASVH